MAADVDAARGLARQHGHDVAQLDLAGDTAFRGMYACRSYLQPRARALQLVEDPLPRRADPARGRRRVRQVLRVPEADQLPQQLLQPLLRHRGDELFDPRVDRSAAPAPAPRLRARRPAPATIQHPRRPESHKEASDVDTVTAPSRVRGSRPTDPRRPSERRVVEVDPGARVAAVGQSDVRLRAGVQAPIGMAGV